MFIGANFSSKAKNTLKNLIDTKIDQLFTVVKETKDLGSSILFKFRNGVENVKEIVLPKCELTEPQRDACINGCFTGETLVNTELGLRRIDSIKEGDKVYAEDVKTGEIALKKVTYVYKKQSKDIIIITIGEEKIETTAPHLFYTENGWEPAERIKVGCRIKNAEKVYEVVRDINARHVEAGEAIYNLNVEEYHTYFVGENRVLVHNDCSVSDEDLKTVTDVGNKGDAEVKNVEPYSVKDGESSEGMGNPLKDYSVEDFSREMAKLPHAQISTEIRYEIIGIPKGQKPDPSMYMSSSEIKDHLSLFDDGVVRIQSKESFEKAMDLYESNIGDPVTGTFVLPKSIVNKAVEASNGNPRILEELLGLDPGYLGEHPIILDINNPSNIRIPSGGYITSSVYPNQ